MGLEGLISIRERPIERELGGGALNHARPDNLRLSLFPPLPCSPPRARWSLELVCSPVVFCLPRI